MLFLVISYPVPGRPSQAAASRQKFWCWIEPKLKSGEALWAYPKVGRGVVTAFEVDSHEALHVLLNEWAEMIPASFEVVPLVDPATGKRFLSRSRAKGR